MSSQEIRQAVLDRLSTVPTGGEGQPPRGIVHSEDFSKILQSLGLQFGHPVVDGISKCFFPPFQVIIVSIFPSNMSSLGSNILTSSNFSLSTLCVCRSDSM